MPYEPPTVDEIRADALQAYRNLVPGADISEDSEIYARATVAAAVAAQICFGVRYVEDQIFPDSADSANLERHGGVFEIDRLEAVAASGGSLELSGTPGLVVAAGLTGLHADGTEYVSTSGVTLDGVTGLGLVDLDAVTTGSVGNKTAGDELVIQTPPAGLDSTATLDTDIEGGTDDELDEAYLGRVLLRMRAGNAGGTNADYVQWASAVDGVIHADCLALRNGPGTVSVAVYSEGVGGFRTPASNALRVAVLAALLLVRPVTAEVDVPAVTPVTQAVTVEILEYEAGYDEADVRAAVAAAIPSHIYGLDTGGGLYRSQLGRAISAVGGVMDYNLTVPAANVAITVDSSVVEVLEPGVVTVT